MKSLTLIAAALLAGAPAAIHANSPTTATLVQGFDVLYALHGSGNSQIYQYSGPLKLRGVTIDWTGFAYSGYVDHIPVDTEETFTVPYTASVNFIAYSWDPQSNFGGASDAQTFTGTSECTINLCSVGGSVSGTYVEDKANLDQWVGSGTITLDSYNSIDPFWCCANEAWFYVGAYGSVTYQLEAGVPEPASWAMMLAGFAAIGGALRRGRQPSLRAAVRQR